MNTKSSLANIGETLGLQPSQFTFLNPPKIDAPSTTILNLDGSARQINDPSKTLRLAIGPERIDTKTLKTVSDERGSSGEPVWRIGDDDRIRFVGSGWSTLATTDGTFNFTASLTDYFEVSFYGTGLNILAVPYGSRDYRASTDGGAEGANFLPASASTILSGRNYGANYVVPVVSNLALGNHTVKIRNNSANNLVLFAVEILNQDDEIKVPQGEIFAGGRKFTNAALQSLVHNIPFDGNPVLNGRGGRVVVYQRANGVIGKVIQQTDSQLNMTSADHANESEIHNINYRKFGANRSDDLSTLAAAPAVRAFTLKDGSTTLVGSSVLINSAVSSDALCSNASGNYITITFVGTGLDIKIRSDDSGLSRNFSSILVDGGASIGSITNASVPVVPQYKKIVSGLPYGSHTVKFVNSGTFDSLGILEFVIYGPKKPAIPSGSVAIGEYYLMANYVANTVAGLDTVATGVLRKQASRELTYIGGAWGINLFTTAIGGVNPGTNTPTNAFEYTFTGTGLEHRAATNTAGSAQIDVLLNGVALTAVNYPTATFSTYGGFSFNSGTGALDGNNSTTNGSGFRVSGLPYGKYTIRFTMTGAGTPGMSAEALDIITPIHYPDLELGSLCVGAGNQLLKNSAEAGIDLSKAKAWIVFDGVNNIINDSYNIQGLLRVTTGQYTVHFTKPFKTSRYVAKYGGTLSQMFPSVNGTPSGGDSGGMTQASFTFTTTSTNGTIGNTALGCLAFFGELEDEE